MDSIMPFIPTTSSTPTHTTGVILSYITLEARSVLFEIHHRNIKQNIEQDRIDLIV